MAKKKTDNKKSGFLVMLFILLVLGIIIIAYKDKFTATLNSIFDTGKTIVDQKILNDDKTQTENNPFKNIKLFNNENKSAENNTKKDNNIKPENNTTTTLLTTTTTINKQVKEKPDNVNNQVIKNEEKKNNKTENTIKIVSKPKDETKPVITKPKIENKKVTSNENNGKNVNIYFTKLSNNDKLILFTARRIIKSEDNPLTETLAYLLSGPTTTESSSSIITNIPNNTKLLSLIVKNNVAYINLSKEFEFNQFGKESTINQLKQIVWTATEFPNIRFVQFLIEGKVKTYLGGEGIIINKPFTRNDFS